jgi:4-hydroxy-tetrahydrodipicolinate synthase
MNTELFKGSWVALVTPFDAELKIDFDAVERLLNMHLKSGTDGLLLCGTTGEAATMSFAEKAELIGFVKKKTEARLPIMFGTGSNDTKAAVELTGRAKDLGADAVLVVTPYYNKPPQKGLIDHYSEVAAATALPVILYNVPGRTGCNIQATTVLELAKIDNIIGVKEASGNLAQLMEIVKNCPDDFLVYSGEDALNLAIMACGGSGTISVTANVAPALMKKFNDFSLSGDFSSARQVHFQLLELHKNLFCETNPLPAKAALAEKGLIEDYVRLPLCRPDKKTRTLLQETSKNLE